MPCSTSSLFLQKTKRIKYTAKTIRYIIIGRSLNLDTPKLGERIAIEQVLIEWASVNGVLSPRSAGLCTRIVQNLFWEKAKTKKKVDPA